MYKVPLEMARVEETTYEWVFLKEEGKGIPDERTGQ